MIVRTRSYNLPLLYNLRFIHHTLCPRVQNPLPDAHPHHAVPNPQPPKVTKTITKKAISKMPSVHLTSEGLPAAPLPEWHAGSDEPLLGKDTPGSEKPKRKRKVKITDAPATELEPIANDASENGIKTLTSLAREITTNLNRFPHCILLTRVGQFYESYFDQAIEVANLLNIKLTNRKWNGGRVAMCGFPILHLDKYLKVLVQQEKRLVAMCEEFPSYGKEGTKTFQRRVTRIITPGTLIDESFLDPLDNNFLLALSPTGETLDAASIIGLAWIDVSTGECFSEHCRFENLQDEIARISPREIVLQESFRGTVIHNNFSSLITTDCPISFTSSKCQTRNAQRILPFARPRKTPPEVEPNVSETTAVILLTEYLQQNLMEHMPVLTPEFQDDNHYRMQIDAHTISSLEIREISYTGGTKGTLLSTMKRTSTPGGSRLLSRWLCSPSTSVAEIRSRQSVVSFFHDRPYLRADVTRRLKELEDIGRVSQKFVLGRGEVNDLISIHTTLSTWKSLLHSLQNEKTIELQTADNRTAVEEAWEGVERVLSNLDPLEDLAAEIANSVILPNLSTSPTDPVHFPTNEVDVATTEVFSNSPKSWPINPEASEALKQIDIQLKQCVSEKEDMERRLQIECDASSLTLRSSPGQGHFVHLAKGKGDCKSLDNDPSFHSISQSNSTKCYFYKPWYDLASDISELLVSRSLAQKDVFDALRVKVIERSDQLRTNAHAIDELDVSISFATLAAELGFVRPDISENESLNIVKGRHPSVETGLLGTGRAFTPNTLEMNPSSNLHIITGPNMGGKSTFLRQAALIAILAQVGSFVPADYASIGIVDRLFSRIGAKDDLFRDRSTFMVEMLETADILRRATPRSLVIMDEIGRGTTMKDGLAIAYATLHHLATINKSRCLFATHFHELAEMVGLTPEMSGSKEFSSARFYCTDIRETPDGLFKYTYRLCKGINRDSHGLKVAELAGIPPEAMKVAYDTLAALKGETSTVLQNPILK